MSQPPRGPDSGPRLLTAADLAERWGVPTGHVYRLSRQGELPTVRLDRYRRFQLAAIERFEHEGGAPPRA